ncbi:MAG TPA: hypothetical protein VGD34_13505 [Kribbella sp.]
MTDATLAGLREVAGQELYRRNAFRITGLPTTVDRRTARQRRHQLTAALDVGADIDLGGSGPVDPDELRLAFERILGDPRRRLVDELFWLWGPSDGTCGCPRTVHQKHDAAVQAHAEALDREASTGGLTETELDQLWTTAGRQWQSALRSAAFWDHLRHRIAALDDRQLDLSAVDALRDELPRTLLKPLVDLAVAAEEPRRLATRVRQWPVSAQTIDRLLEEAAGPLYDQLEDKLDELMRQLRDGLIDAVAGAVRGQVRATLDRLDAIVPHERHRRTAQVRDRVAILLNNCASQLLEAGSVTDGRAERWLDSAYELALDSRERETISQNRTTLVEMRDAFGQIESQVRLLVATGRTSEAKAMLRRVRRLLGDSPGVQEIDQMLSTLTNGTRGRTPTTRPPQRQYGSRYGAQYRPRRRVGRKAFWLVVAAAVVFGIVHFWPGGKARVFSEKIADNAPVGTCLATEAAWRKGRTEVPTRNCAEPHWAEVLGYPAVSAAPGAYPGADQAEALTSFACLESLAQQGLSASTYLAEHTVAAAKDWNEGGKKYENYAVCIVRRLDGKDIPGGRITKPDQPKTPRVVQMPVFSNAIWTNAPVGTCVQTKQGLEGSKDGTVPVLRCEATHWAEIYGYPVLYQPGSRWPGANAVYAAASAACSKLLGKQRLPAGFTYRVGWPAQNWWKDPKQTIYANCLIHRVDNKPFKARA